MHTRIGTSGYAYTAWKGSFYPAKLPARDFLTYYATQFSTVELNNTFYRSPSIEQARAWGAEVPEDFVFAIKAPQRITHRERLRGSEASLAALFSALAPLGTRRGPLLFQLPPFSKKDVPLLSAFLAALPAGRAAFEFRHPSWFADDCYEALRTAGAALCIADDAKLSTPVVATTDWGYVRLRQAEYDDTALDRWAAALKAQGWRQAFVYFKHEETGTGPRFAASLRERLPGP